MLSLKNRKTLFRLRLYNFIYIIVSFVFLPLIVGLMIADIIDTSQPNVLPSSKEEIYFELGHAFSYILIAVILWRLRLFVKKLLRRWADSAAEYLYPCDIDSNQQLRHCLEQKIPYALFLRGFKEEQDQIQEIQAIPISLSVTTLLNVTRWVEYVIVDEFTKRNIPVFCLSNPLLQSEVPGVFRIKSKIDDWLKQVEEMATEAQIIILYVSSITQGILQEIEALERLKLITKTICIVESFIADSLNNSGKQYLSSFPIILIVPSKWRRRFRLWKPDFKNKVGLHINRVNSTRPRNSKCIKNNV